MPSEQKPLYGANPNSWNSDALERSVQGLTAVLLSLKKKPVIRYERMSGMAKKLASEVHVSVMLAFQQWAVAHLRYAAPHSNRNISIRLQAYPSSPSPSHIGPKK